MRDIARLCPTCGSTEVDEVVYGYPGEELLEAVRQRRVVLGGCVVSPDSPRWSCAGCGLRWGRWLDSEHATASGDGWLFVKD